MVMGLRGEGGNKAKEETRNKLLQPNEEKNFRTSE